MCSKLVCFETFIRVEYLRERLEHTTVEPRTGLYINSRLLVLLTNIRLGWKRLEVANTLAYCDTATIDAVKHFIVHTPGFVLSPTLILIYLWQQGTLTEGEGSVQLTSLY